MITPISATTAAPIPTPRARLPTPGPLSAGGLETLLADGSLLDGVDGLDVGVGEAVAAY